MLGQMKRLMGKQQNAFRFLLPIRSRLKFIVSYLFTKPRLQLGPPPLPPPYWLLYLLHSILYCGGGQRRRGGVSQRGRRGILFSPSKSPSRPSLGRTRTDGPKIQSSRGEAVAAQQSHEIDTVLRKEREEGAVFVLGVQTCSFPHSFSSCGVIWVCLSPSWD